MVSTNSFIICTVLQSCMTLPPYLPPELICTRIHQKDEGTSQQKISAEISVSGNLFSLDDIIRCNSLPL